MEFDSKNHSGIGISEEHLALADAVAGFAGRHLPPELARTAVEQIEDGPGEQIPACWNAIAAQGLLGLHIPEHFGGSGAGLTELAVALEVLGRHLAPGPYTPTVLASAILTADAGHAATELLAGLAGGSVRGAVALGDRIRASRNASGTIRLDGSTAALGAANAEIVLLSVELDDASAWIAVDTALLSVHNASCVDVTRSTAVVRADAVEISAARVLANIDDEQVAAIAAIVLGAEAVGVGSWCVATASDYAKLRVQFGRPIGQFQGVKHRCAQAAIAVEQARAAVWDAARAVDAGDDTAAYAAAVASLLAPDAAVGAARDAMQVLGGIGYTWEHDAHLYYRRALTLRGLLGSGRAAATAVARLALAGNRREVAYELPERVAVYRAEVRADLARIAALDSDAQLVALGDEGWVMPHLQPPFGRYADPAEQIVIAQEMERAGIVTPQLGLATWLLPSIAVHGNDMQKQELVAPTLRGEILWCQLFSEPEAGSDLASLRTEARKVEGGWLVNGQKIWTSLGFIAEWGGLIARTNPDAPKHQGITYFVVDMRSPGITARALREASGGTLFSEVFFDDVFIPDSGVVGAVDGGWQVARGTLGDERVALGKGLPLYATVEDLLRFVTGRGSERLPLERVGEMVAQNQAMILLNGRTVAKQLLGQDVSAGASVAKYLGMRLGQQIADFCHAELGAAGVYEQADPAAAQWIEQTISSRPMTIYGGTTEIQLNVIAERILGLPRDPEPAAL